MEHAVNPDALDKQVICDLVNSGLIDCDLLNRIVQLMMMPEFSEFFEALGEVDLNNAGDSAAVLSRCAKKMARPIKGASNLAKNPPARPGGTKTESSSA